MVAVPDGRARAERRCRSRGLRAASAAARARGGAGRPSRADAVAPALVEGDLGSFGAALTEVQRVTGAWFAAQQGGIFAPGPSGRRWYAGWRSGAPQGVGQSSWGPAVYGLVEGRGDRGRASGGARGDSLGSGGQVFEGGFAGAGARVWAGPDPGLNP